MTLYFLGYHQDPERTVERFVGEGRYWLTGGAAGIYAGLAGVSKEAATAISRIPATAERLPSTRFRVFHGAT